MSQGLARDKDSVIEALRPYLQLGCSVNKACNYAGIAQSTVQTWIDNDPDLRLKFTSWRNMVSASARKNIAECVIKGEIEESKWWLERREKADFSTRSELSGADGKPVIMLNVGVDPYRDKEGNLLKQPDLKKLKSADKPKS
jgi:hypothetical protein|tara:strand:+ start:964 stop:1389 length:426 start_codon:yes stop_codon:yes gene_type:complete